MQTLHYQQQQIPSKLRNYYSIHINAQLSTLSTILLHFKLNCLIPTQWLKLKFIFSHELLFFGHLSILKSILGIK